MALHLFYGPGMQSSIRIHASIARPGWIAGLLVCIGLGATQVGCGAGPAPGDTAAEEHLWAHQPQEVRIAALRREVAKLGPGVSPAEADRLATLAIQHAEFLASKYHMSRPVELHNMMVSVGLRPRGKCFQLANDLYLRLRAERFRTLALCRGIADADDFWNEHSCVVVTARGKPFSTGLVLDAWRYAGKLRWIGVAADHHPWKLKTNYIPGYRDMR